MDRSDEIILLTEERYQDALLVWHSRPAERRVFCSVSSVTASEFFEGGRNGLNPEYRFEIFFGDYAGEQLLRYKGDTYAIYRTYRAKNDVLELYAERKGGTNGKGDA